MGAKQQPKKPGKPRQKSKEILLVPEDFHKTSTYRFWAGLAWFVVMAYLATNQNVDTVKFVVLAIIGAVVLRVADSKDLAKVIEAAGKYFGNLPSKTSQSSLPGPPENGS